MIDLINKTNMASKVKDEKTDRILELVKEGIQCGFAAAMKMYQPLKDELRMRELASWCLLNGVPKSAVEALIERKAVEVKTISSGRNSPKYISIEQLKSALLAEHVRVMLV